MVRTTDKNNTTTTQNTHQWSQIANDETLMGPQSQTTQVSLSPWLPRRWWAQQSSVSQRAVSHQSLRILQWELSRMAKALNRKAPLAWCCCCCSYGGPLCSFRIPAEPGFLSGSCCCNACSLAAFECNPSSGGTAVAGSGPPSHAWAGDSTRNVMNGICWSLMRGMKRGSEQRTGYQGPMPPPFDWYWLDWGRGLDGSLGAVWVD